MPRHRGDPWFNNARVVVEEIEVRKGVRNSPAVQALRGAGALPIKIVNFRNRAEKYQGWDYSDERRYEREEEIEERLHQEKIEAFLAGPKTEAIEATEWLVENATWGGRSGAILTVLAALDELKKLARMLRGETLEEPLDEVGLWMGLFAMVPANHADVDEFIKKRGIVEIALVAMAT